MTVSKPSSPTPRKSGSRSKAPRKAPSSVAFAPSVGAASGLRPSPRWDGHFHRSFVHLGRKQSLHSRAQCLSHVS